MTTEQHFRKLECAYHRAPCNRYYRPVLSVSRGAARLSVEVREDMFHAAGAVHGSVLFKMLDDAAFFAANSVVEDVFLLTSAFHVDMLRPVSRGTLTAQGRLVHASSRVYVADAVVHDSDGSLIARGSGSFMRSKIRLEPSIGYE